MKKGKTSYLKSTCIVGDDQSISYKSIVETFSGYKSVQNKSCKGQWRERDRETEKMQTVETAIQDIDYRGEKARERETERDLERQRKTEIDRKILWNKELISRKAY